MDPFTPQWRIDSLCKRAGLPRMIIDCLKFLGCCWRHQGQTPTIQVLVHAKSLEVGDEIYLKSGRILAPNYFGPVDHKDRDPYIIAFADSNNNPRLVGAVMEHKFMLQHT
jgi:hypothetical protein